GELVVGSSGRWRAGAGNTSDYRLTASCSPGSAPRASRTAKGGTSMTTYSFTEKKRIRKDFGKQRSILEVPFLLAIQVDSYREFLQADTDPAKRRDTGLHAALKSVFPIVSYSGNAAPEYVGYKLGEPVFDERQCRN